MVANALEFWLAAAGKKYAVQSARYGLLMFVIIPLDDGVVASALRFGLQLLGGSMLFSQPATVSTLCYGPAHIEMVAS